MKAGLKDQAVMAALGFGLGVATTVGFARLPHRHARPSSDVLVQKFTRQLNLSADQQKTVRGALEDSRAKLEALHADTDAKLKEIRLGTRAGIRKILDADQQQRFDEMARRWDARHDRKEE